MSWYQKQIRLSPQPRGCHLVHQEIVSQVPEIRDYKVGMANVFLQHTSASLMINENADRTVRSDMSMGLDRIVPEDWPYEHDYEGSDDMPGHLKSGIVGTSLNIPITNGRLNTGTWQGIYLCEHRNHGGSRKVVVTLQGEKS
ncbi:upf0047 protein yjbq [Lichtheimia corymbifera JMRC:FSU:9682]|uniref:Upf0047 protein yjbq n=1 Tax=Lichtheimia corymbifera JMRC:FSU:9682 TaxID=1263082 RepID=A0A068SDH9_9FUNG|nr:upf0047 protein yjbq [Lichtheimia corymbifera JMRC:FSU:9682]